MTIAEYNQIKDKVAKLKDKASREKGAMDQLMVQMRELIANPDASLDDAQEYMVKLGERKERLETKWEKTSAKLEAVTDWSTL
jgi:hypothetical protein